MTTTIETKQTISIDLTPEEIGKFFALMNDEEQARFFEGVYQGLCEWEDLHNYSYGEGQWWYVAKRLKAPGMENARKTLMALCAWNYVHAEPTEHY